MRGVSLTLSTTALLLVITSGVSAQKVPVKYTDSPDDKAITGGAQHNGTEPEQVLKTYVPDDVGPSHPENHIDFECQDGEIDALASQENAFFSALTKNQAHLLISFGGDSNHKCVYYQTPEGRRGVKWAHWEFSNYGYPLYHDPNLEDVDALEVYGQPKYFSLKGDPWFPGAPPWKTSVASVKDGVCTTFVSRDEVGAQISMLGFVGNPDDVDVDGLVVQDHGEVGVWDDPDTIIFSITAAGNWDGGEIVVMPNSTASSFLTHGGKTWNTGFNVKNAFGVNTEEVDAIEAYTAPAAAPALTQWGLLIFAGLFILSLIFMLRRRRARVPSGA